jgi:hypothetical protein
MRTRLGARPGCGCALDAIVLRRRRRLLIGPAWGLFIGFVATDHATCDSPDFAVPCQMARDAANDSALDASLCLGGGGGERYAQNSNTKDHCPGALLSFRGHVVLVEFSGTIPMHVAVSIAGIALMIAQRL